MNKKLALALLVALLAAVGFFLMRQGERGGGRGVRETETVRAPEPEPAALEQGTRLEPVVERTAAPERAPVGSAQPASMRGELAGLVGRLVESDGRPVPGMRVALLEFEAGILFDAAGLDEPERSLELEETVTNAEGRFVLNGARAQAIHALGIDLGGPRATFRVLDHGLVHRERVDIGDVVLAPYGVLTGRAVGEDGAPIAGARVRVAPLPADVLQAQPQDFRPDSLIAVSMTPMGGTGHLLIELPGWVRSAIERFPIPTTQSAADGTFRLEGVPLTSILVGVDRRGLVGANAGPIDMSGGTHDLGDVVLKRGRTVTGVVEDDGGDPVAGVEVFAGAELVPGIAAMLQPAGLSDENGEFRLEGVYETGNIVASARRSRSEAWKTSVSPRAEGVLIELGSLVSLTVNVRDPAGQPLSGVDVRVAPAQDSSRQVGFFNPASFLPRPSTPTGTFTEVEPGRYVNAKLGAGTYEVAARQAGFAPGFLEASCLAETNEVTLIMPAGRRLAVTVVEAGSKAPVTEAQVNVLRASGAGFTKLAGKRTGADGLVNVGPLPTFAAPAQQSFMPEQTFLQVQHPRYGEHATVLAPETTELVVELQAGGTLVGKVHWGGAVPTRLYMVTLEFRGADDFLELFHLPRFTVTDLAGEFRVTNLVPGKYRAALSERFLQSDPLAMMSERFEPPTLFRQEIEVRNGETTELVIDLTPSGRGATARIRGHVRYDGRNLAGAKVRFSGNGSVELETDSSGRFESPELSCMERTLVRITADLSLGGNSREIELYSEWLQLERDEMREINLDLYPIAVRARVVSDPGGDPIADASVGVTLQRENRGWFQDESWRTDAGGEVELFVLEPGKYQISAEGGGYTRASEAVEIPAEGRSEPVVVRLRRSVPCAGRVQLDPALSQGGEGFSYLWVRSEQGNTSGTQIQAPDYTFALENLPPGKYTAQLFLRGRRGEQVEFELGPNGDENLLLVFLPDEGEDD